LTPETWVDTAVTCCTQAFLRVLSLALESVYSIQAEYVEPGHEQYVQRLADQFVEEYKRFTATVRIGDHCPPGEFASVTRWVCPEVY
jgi:hypothetical protein